MKEYNIRKVKFVFAGIMILTGLMIVAYPFVAQMVSEKNATQRVAAYDQEVQQMDAQKLDAVKENAKSYNEQLKTVEEENEAGAGRKQTGYIDLVEIGSILGYISIPCIDLKVPVYEGTSDTVLAHGIGHLTQTSYPLGGAGTHSVLSGHRGMAEHELFTNLDKVEMGNYFYLHILDEVLAYQVDSIRIVEPDDTTDLYVVDQEDLCSLVTCTPIGINSHRLIVRGHRVADFDENQEAKALYKSVHTGTVIRRMTQIWPWMVLAFTSIIFVEAMFMVTIIKRMRSRMEDD